MRRPLYEIEGLISFYPHFRTSPPKAVQLAVCHDLTCWLHGSDERIRETKAKYGDDVEIEIVEVSCLGRCDVAPAAAVDERPLALAQADAAIAAARAGEHEEPEALRRDDERRPNDPYEPGAERYRSCAARSPASLRPESIVATLKDSGLRGHGRRRLPDRPEVGDRRRPGARAEVHDLQRRRVRARARSRTARSSPSSPISCWRGCCSGCS